MKKQNILKRKCLLALIAGGIFQSSPITYASIRSDESEGHQTTARILEIDEITGFRKEVVRKRFDIRAASPNFKHVGGYYQIGSFKQDDDKKKVSRNIKPSDLPLGNYTHLYLAFLQVNANDYTIISPSVNKLIDDLKIAKEKNPNLKIIWSVGGANTSKIPEGKDESIFMQMVATRENRNTFISSIINLLENTEAEHKLSIDGIDIDWEWKGTLENKHSKNYVTLMTELKERLIIKFPAQGEKWPSRKSLSAAISAGLKIDDRIWADFALQVTHINLMTYSWSGTGSKKVMPHAPLIKCKESVGKLIGAGMPASKIILGVAFYGKGFYKIKNTDDIYIENIEKIFGKTCLPWEWTKAIEGEYTDTDLPAMPKDDPADGTFVPRAFSYFHLDQEFRDKNGWKYRELLDEDHTVSVFFNKKIAQSFSEKKASTILCESPDTVKMKVEYIIKQKLGGVFAWDAGDDNGKLLNALVHP